MRKKLAVMVGVALLGTGLLAMTQLPAQSAGTTTFSVFDVDGPFSKFIDVGKAGFGPGDVILENHPLLDPTSGDQVGKSVTKITLVKVKSENSFLFIIDCTIKLQDGDITFYGAGNISELGTTEGFVAPVTGGSGTYFGMNGTVTGTFDEVDGKSGAMLTFDLA